MYIMRLFIINDKNTGRMTDMDSCRGMPDGEQEQYMYLYFLILPEDVLDKTPKQVSR
jgi:hypothetical protein